MRQIDGEIIVRNHLQAITLRCILRIYQFRTFLRENSLDILHTLRDFLAGVLQLAHRHCNHELVEHRQGTLGNVLMSYRKWVECTRKNPNLHKCLSFYGASPNSTFNI